MAKPKHHTLKNASCTFCCTNLVYNSQTKTSHTQECKLYILLYQFSNQNITHSRMQVVHFVVPIFKPKHHTLKNASCTSCCTNFQTKPSHTQECKFRCCYTNFQTKTSHTQVCKLYILLYQFSNQNITRSKMQVVHVVVPIFKPKHYTLKNASCTCCCVNLVYKSKAVKLILHFRLQCLHISNTKVNL